MKPSHPQRTMTTIPLTPTIRTCSTWPQQDLSPRAAARDHMIPSSTGAAKALPLVIPELKGKLAGYAMLLAASLTSAS